MTTATDDSSSDPRRATRRLPELGLATPDQVAAAKERFDSMTPAERAAHVRAAGLIDRAAFSSFRQFVKFLRQDNLDRVNDGAPISLDDLGSPLTMLRALRAAYLDGMRVAAQVLAETTASLLTGGRGRPAMTLADEDDPAGSFTAEIAEYLPQPKRPHDHPVRAKVPQDPGSLSDKQALAFIDYVDGLRQDAAQEKHDA